MKLIIVYTIRLDDRLDTHFRKKIYIYTNRTYEKVKKLITSKQYIKINYRQVNKFGLDKNT